MFFRLIQGSRRDAEGLDGQAEIPVNPNESASSRSSAKCPTPQKLIALRARTDHDLLVLVSRELDKGFSTVQLATTKSSQHYTQAQKAYQTATALLPRIAGLSQDDRLRTESKLDELRCLLDQVPVYANVRSYPASVAS
jgi:hypothetical protein